MEGHINIEYVKREFNRVTKAPAITFILYFLLDRGVKVNITINGIHYRRSPLVQGGIKVPCNLSDSLPGYSSSNHVLLQQYLEIVSDLYLEPTNEEIIGSFLIPNEGSSCANRRNSEHPGPSKKGRLANAQPKSRQGLDIRTLFQRAKKSNREIKGQQNKDSSVVIKE